MQRFYCMNIPNLLLILCLAFTSSACAVFRSGSGRAEPDLVVRLKINSLHAKEIQEKGVLGTEDGDELTLVYTLKAYGENGDLLAVNNGYWGTRTIAQGALIKPDEFDQISVRLPKEGKIILALSLIEIDDYKGERRIAKVKPHTKSERHPNFLRISNFEEDQNRPSLELITASLQVAGYRNFMRKHLTLSANDYLGGTKQILDAADLGKIESKASSGQETYEMDGSQINENYLYVLKYDLDVVPFSD